MITSWYQCGFGAVFGTLRFITLPAALFGVFSCRCLFICRAGTAGTKTLGPGLPSPGFVLLGARSGPTSAQAGESFGREDAGSRVLWLPAPLPAAEMQGFVEAASPANLPLLPYAGSRKPGGQRRTNAQYETAGAPKSIT